MNSSSLPSSFTREEIAARAHAIWEQKGRPEGQELEHWLQAEKELNVERTQAGKVETELTPTESSATSETGAPASDREAASLSQSPGKRSGTAPARRPSTPKSGGTSARRSVVG